MARQAWGSGAAIGDQTVGHGRTVGILPAPMTPLAPKPEPRPQHAARATLAAEMIEARRRRGPR